MKHKMRDAMRAVILDACNALPGADARLSNSSTRAATAMADLLVLSVMRKYRKGDDAVAMARDIVAHGDFPLGIAAVRAAFVASVQNKSSTHEIAGIKFQARYSGVTPEGAYDFRKSSYALDTTYSSYHDRTPDPVRVAAIVEIFREEIARAMPDMDVGTVREGVDEKGQKAVIHPGWGEAYDMGDQVEAIHTSTYAHGSINQVRETVAYRIKTQVSRRNAAAGLMRRKEEIRRDVETGIAALAPDMPLTLVDVRITDRYGNVKIELVYEGTGFDFRPGPITSQMKSLKPNDHYVRHNLPGIIAAQRELRSRMDEGDPDNLLVEEPLARLLMERFGDAWTDKVEEIRAKPGGVYDEDGAWRAKIQRGILRGTFEIGDKARWRDGTLHVTNQLPEVVLMQLPGKLLSEIVDHSYFGSEARIVSAASVDAYRKLPNGGWGMAFSHVALRTDVPSLRLGDFREEVPRHDLRRAA